MKNEHMGNQGRNELIQSKWQGVSFQTIPDFSFIPYFCVQTWSGCYPLWFMSFNAWQVFPQFLSLPEGYGIFRYGTSLSPTNFKATRSHILHADMWHLHQRHANRNAIFLEVTQQRTGHTRCWLKSVFWWEWVHYGILYCLHFLHNQQWR